MKVPRTGKTWAMVLLLAAGLLVAWFSQQRADSLPPVREKTDKPPVSVAVPKPVPGADFDFYLLAMTLHPAFCADGHARKPECRAGMTVPLAIHGLWPERLAPGRYPQDCPGPALDLDAALALELAPLMPGMTDGLHEHEWRKHGACSGLDDDQYFRHVLDLARRLDAALRAKLTTLQGDSTSAAELREFADAFAPGLGGTLTFHCRTLRNAPATRRGEAYLTEIRQCLDNDGPGGAPGVPLACASVERRDQGCGRSFHIAGNRIR